VASRDHDAAPEDRAVHGPLRQGEWLRKMGLEKRAAALSKADPSRAEVFGRHVHRLTHPSEMGVIFKAICLSSPKLPAPAGFESPAPH
jgi:NADH dehydrogenase [ubiquinone] 1 alpha subcomplex assembly factor 7